MTLDKKMTLVALAWFAIGALCGFFMGKGIYQPTCGEKVARDTVYVRDTVPDYHPAPKDSATIKYVTRWLPVTRHDTVDLFRDVAQMVHDTVEVQVPITSKHYQAKDYDAWVSGFEVSLDSIKVYKETQYITETITRMKPPNKWELDLIGGLDYNTASQDFTPYAGGEILYKPNWLQVGVRAVVSKTANTGKFEPSVGGVVKIRVF